MVVIPVDYLQAFESIVESLVASGVFTGAGFFSAHIKKFVENRRIRQKLDVSVLSPAQSMGQVELLLSTMNFYLNRHEQVILSELTEFWNLRNDIFLLLRRYDDEQKAGRVVGGCIVYPIKARCGNDIYRGRKTAAQVALEDIPTKGRPRNYYVGFAWGESKVDQAILCILLYKRIIEQGEKNGFIFSRPTTKESLVFVQRNGARRCGAGEGPPSIKEICYLPWPTNRPLKGILQRVHQMPNDRKRLEPSFENRLT